MEKSTIGATKNPLLAAGLNLLATGLGYFYLGLWQKGLLIFGIAILASIFTVGIGYLIPLIFSILDSYNTAERINRGEQVTIGDSIRDLIEFLRMFLRR